MPGLSITSAGISGTLNPDLFRFTGATSSYPNPMYRFIHTFIPQNMLELLAWCEFIYNNSPQLGTSIRRFSEYPITEVEFPVDDKHTKKYKDYFYASNLKDLLISCGIDFHVYGNAFVSPYYPFVRYLICSKCKEKFNADAVDYSFTQNKGYLLDCSECGHNGPVLKAFDKKIRDPKQLKWIRWDPKTIEIEYNQISGEAKYHLKIPQTIFDAIQKKNLQILKSTPQEIIEAVIRKKRFVFKKGTIYHMKANTPAGFPSGWGFPLLSQALYEVLHISVLKRANEAIAWEHIVPRLMVSPAPSGTSGDPLRHISMAKWKDELKLAKNRWNKDPNYVQFVPFPINVQQLGGNGRALMVAAEIEAAEKNLAMALGIPLEFAAGTLAWQTSAMSLRLLKNQMYTMVSKMERLIQWIVDTTSRFLGWPSFKVKLEPFELADDEVRKNLLLQLNASQKVSDETLFSALGLDYDEELEKIKEEQIKQFKSQNELQQQLLEEQQSAITSARRKETMSGQEGQSPDLDSAVQQAREIASSLLSATPAQRAQALDELAMNNIGMHALVKKFLDDLVQIQQGQEAQMRMSQEQNMVSSNVMGGGGVTTLNTVPEGSQGT